MEDPVYRSDRITEGHSGKSGLGPEMGSRRSWSRRRERDPALAVTATHDIVCNSSALRRCDGNAANTQARFKLMVTRSARATSGLLMKLASGREDHTVFRFASSLSALGVLGPIVLV